MSGNSFTLKEIPADGVFCDRNKEMKDLISFARSNTNVILYSPRRYGKTSLARRVQAKLESEKYLTAYCDFFGVTSIEEIAGRIVRSIYGITRRNETLFNKAVKFLTSFKPVLTPAPDGSISVSVQPASKNTGIDELEDMMASLEKFVKDASVPVHIVFDEFQEITELSNSAGIEGVLRKYIQRIGCSFVFVGSRRGVLLGMFNDKKRPFFQSGVLYALKELPENDLADFIMSGFSSSGKSVSKELALSICSIIKQHPYYAQKLCLFLYESSGKKVKSEDVNEAYESVLESEKALFESILSGLKTNQMIVLKAIAKEPSKNLFSAGYMQRHNIASTGGIRNGLDILLNKDIIEKDKDTGIWFVVDPVFSDWLNRMQL